MSMHRHRPPTRREAAWDLWVNLVRPFLVASAIVLTVAVVVLVLLDDRLILGLS